MNEWEKFKVGKPKVGINPTCQSFESVSHVSHIASAISIIEAGAIRPSLVFDKSKLNEQRILVSWLSPNHWTLGYRYGNISFDFSFDKIIKDKRFYWVEAIPYSPSACRILITDIDRDSELDTYDPTSRLGPWWFDSKSKQHYFNNEYCLEFMVEDTVELSNLSNFSFVKHHEKYCSVHRNDSSKCDEINQSPYEGGALFLTRATVAKLNLTSFSRYFVNSKGKPDIALEAAYQHFASKVSRNVKYSGSLTSKSRRSIAVGRAIMSAYTFGSLEEAKLLSALFNDEDSLFDVIAKLTADTVGLTTWTDLRSPYE